MRPGCGGNDDQLPPGVMTAPRDSSESRCHWRAKPTPILLRLVRHDPCAEGAGVHQSAAVLPLPLRSNRGEQRVRQGLASRIAFLFSSTSSRIAPLEAHVCRAFRMSLTRTPSTCGRPRHGKDPPQVTYRPWMLRAAATSVALAAVAATFPAFAVAQATRVRRRRPWTGTIRWTMPSRTTTWRASCFSSAAPATGPREAPRSSPGRVHGCGSQTCEWDTARPAECNDCSTAD
jgi:hypothetical protein